ncbi:nuclear transport factor 2 family protein [Actinoallomurus sp. CA-150999]|uniref:nuclear transport factor 2 family protein n=1 Tax=Actinoallomurus sp. CA-150999 TaxID=3239887 RepID=UPI003D8CD440
MSITDTDRQRVVEGFALGWRNPEPHAWDDLLAADICLEQPLLGNGRGQAVWHRGLAQLLTLVPDLRGRVHGWAGHGDVLYIDIELTGTLGGRSHSVRAVDRLTLDERGLVTARRSFLDPVPLALAIATRPAAWPAWWRSGLPPLAGRAAKENTARVVAALGATRLLVGLTTLAAPQLARRAVGLPGALSDDRGLFVRLFAARDAALGAATLSSDPAVSDLGLRLGALCDLADVAAGLLAGRRVMALAAAGFAAAAGLALLSE